MIAIFVLSSFVLLLICSYLLERWRQERDYVGALKAEISVVRDMLKAAEDKCSPAR